MEYDVGSFVSLKLLPERKMQVVGMDIYADGGYQYKCNWVDPEGMIRTSSHFETELEPFE